MYCFVRNCYNEKYFKRNIENSLRENVESNKLVNVDSNEPLINGQRFVITLLK